MREETEETSPQKRLLAAIGPEVKKIEEAMRCDLQVATSQADPLLVEILEYGIFNGGKRLRPLLAVLSARLCGLQGEKIYDLAIAFEYLHAATLFHDDVIDRGETRRGKPSVNKAFGEVAAILCGDFLHSRSMFLVGSRGGSASLEVFCRAANGMVDGEFLQLRNSRNHNLSEEDYFTVVKGKTALLLAATCEIGALAAGASLPQQQALSHYGLNLGIGFQIVDDLLDYLGDAKQTGKAIGNDFQEEKMTLPLIAALTSASPEDKKRLLFLLDNDEARQTGFSEACALIDKYNGFALSRNRAESLVADAVAGLAVFSEEAALPPAHTLRALAEYVLTRNK
ncbi:MAG: polyprenyl synthetase family protein [Proteobacteria bacterium]|nr:polyprenyl synthetase family protein [Pseudomonadota bacterium]MBU1059649.1 polyprenyl synthetase family protein [Pseudomonadota bacterium]